MASPHGLEPRPRVLETRMLPLHYGDINFGGPQTKKIKIGVNADLTAGDLANGISISSEKIEIKNSSSSAITVSSAKIEIKNTSGI